MNNNTSMGLVISLFKFKSFGQFDTPETASNFRHLLSCGTIETMSQLKYFNLVVADFSTERHVVLQMPFSKI